MLESLKTLRFLHQILVVVAAGVLVLSLTPDPSNAYNKALEELNALKTIERQQPDYGSYLRKNVAPSNPTEGSHFKDLARSLGIRVVEPIEFNFQVFVSDYVFTGPRLADYENFFEVDHHVVSLEFVFDKKLEDSWKQFLKNQVAIQGRGHEVSFEKFDLAIVGVGRQSDGTQIMTWQNLPPEQQGKGTLYFVFANSEPESNPDFSVPLTVSYRIGKQVTGTFALDWLMSSKIGRKLVDSKSKTVFPQLKKLDFWNGLRLKETDAAVSYIQAKLDSINLGAVSFFGISVNKSLVVWAGPFACFCISWLFLSHLKRFQILAIRDESLLNYPWIALFPGRANGLTTYFSFLFPIVADGLLLARYGHWNHWSTWFGVVLTLGVAATIASTFRELHKLRSD